MSKGRLQRFILKMRREPNLLLRRLTQLFVVVVIIAAGVQFAGFVDLVRGVAADTGQVRPPVVEGFLPIAAIVALIGYLEVGVIDTIHPAGFVILVTTLVTAFLFRRGFCSFICPIGTFSEFLGKVGLKKKGRAVTLPRWFDLTLLGAKYLIFLYTFNLFFLMPGDEALSFMTSPYYAISDIKMFDLFARIGFVGLGVISTLIILTLLVKSFWCRYLCPYGALLGAISFISPLRLHRNDDLCISCGRCNEVCPNVVEVEKGMSKIASPECMGCTSCVSACPKEGALTFRVFGKVVVKPLVIA